MSDRFFCSLADCRPPLTLYYLSVVECEAPLSVSYLYRFYYYLKNCNLTLRASNLLATLDALSYFFLFSVIIQKVCNYWNEGNKNTNTNTSIILKCFISTHQLSMEMTLVILMMFAGTALTENKKVRHVLDSFRIISL